VARDKHSQHGVDAPYPSGPLAGLTRNVIVLSWVSFFADISSEMLYPLLPLFMTATLHAPVAIVGLIEGIAEAAASLGKPLAGRWSDASGRRRPWMLGGYGASALAKGLLALAAAWPLALMARLVDRIGKGLRGGPRDALLADSVEHAYLGKAIGVNRAMDSLGAVAGPLLSLLLLNTLHLPLRRILWLAVLPGLASAALVLLAREAQKGQEQRGERIGQELGAKAEAGRKKAGGGGTGKAPRVEGQREEAEAKVRQAGAASALTPGLRWFLIAWSVFAVCNSSDVFLLLRAKVVGFSTTGVVALFALYSFVYAMLSPALGRLSDLWQRRGLLIAGLGVYAAVYACFALAHAPWQAAALFAVYGVYMAATDGVAKAYALDLAPPGAKAQAAGWLGLVTGLGALAASVIAGQLWDHVAPASVFVYGATGALLAAGMLGLARPLGARAPSPAS
jgi:MFS family permease